MLIDNPVWLSLSEWAGDPLVGCQMSHTEQLMLFSCVISLRPRRLLEIGFYKGGSSLITLHALDALSRLGEFATQSKLVALDPHPSQPDALGRFNNFHLISGCSPSAIPLAIEMLGGLDFAFIDGNHDQLGADLRAIWPVLEPGGHILLHDINYAPLHRALTSFLAGAPDGHFVQIGNWTADHGYGGLGLLE